MRWSAGGLPYRKISRLTGVVLVVVALVLGVPMSVVEIVHMIAVLDGFMAAIRAVHVRVVGGIMLAMFFGRCHFTSLFHLIGVLLSMEQANG